MPPPEEPDVEAPDAEEPDAEEPDAEEPDAEEPDTEKPNVVEPMPELTNNTTEPALSNSTELANNNNNNMTEANATTHNNNNNTDEKTIMSTRAAVVGHGYMAYLMYVLGEEIEVAVVTTAPAATWLVNIAALTPPTPLPGMTLLPSPVVAFFSVTDAVLGFATELSIQPAATQLSSKHRILPQEVTGDTMLSGTTVGGGLLFDINFLQLVRK